MTFPSIALGAGKLPETAGITSGGDFTNVTSAGSTHTKGSYVELIASTSFDSRGFMLSQKCEVNSRKWLSDIAIGGAGSEQVIIANVPYNCTESTERWQVHHGFFNIAIPAGTRISVRTQSDVASSSLQIGLHLFPQGGLHAGPHFQRCVTYGVNTGSTTGTSMDPGGTANTKGAWYEFTSSCVNPVRQIVVCSNRYNTLPDTAHWGFDLAVGAAGSEEIVIGDLYFLVVFGDGYTTRPYFYPPLPVDIPAGSRIACRVMSTWTASPDRLAEHVLFCLD